MISIVTTAYNESENLPVLYDRLCKVFDAAGVAWELITVDDHSTDDTFAVISAIAAKDPRLRGFRLSRNVGSHSSIFCALEHARGDFMIQVASDLQHPPELLPDVVREWEQGGQVVWVARARRDGDKRTTVGFARLYYFLMRHVVGMKEMPPDGADFFGLDRKVVDALLQCGEHNVSLVALINWMGFPQRTIYYNRPPRLHGRSGWTLEKKLKLVIDSITSFTYLPIRVMSYTGLVFAVFGFLYAALTVRGAIYGHPVEGWASLMVVVLVGLGLQMLMIGVLGEYLWRALDESRRRPRYFVESSTFGAPPVVHPPAAERRP